VGQRAGRRAAVDVALKPKMKEGDSMKRTSQIPAVSTWILGLGAGGSAQQKEAVDYALSKSAANVAGLRLMCRSALRLLEWMNRLRQSRFETVGGPAFLFQILGAVSQRWDTVLRGEIHESRERRLAQLSGASE
jgi:hypothetical protein